MAQRSSSEPRQHSIKGINLAPTPRDEHDIHHQNPSSGATGTDLAEIFRGFRNRAFPFTRLFRNSQRRRVGLLGQAARQLLLHFERLYSLLQLPKPGRHRGRDQILPGAHRPDLAAACPDNGHGIRARIRSERGIPAPRMGLDNTVCGTRQSSDDSVVDSALGDARDFQRSLVVDLDRVVLLPALPACSL